MALTEFERLTLAILRDSPEPMISSQVGYALFEGEKENRKKNPTPQGMALAAGRFLGPLSRRGLIHSGLRGWSLSAKGKEALLADAPETQA